jgi:hypothetical protein
MAQAHLAGLRCVGVKETDERHCRPDFAAEKQGAQMLEEPYVEQNLRLLDEVCFIPFRREVHEIGPMLEEIVRQSKAVSPLVPVGAGATHPRQRRDTA